MLGIIFLSKDEQVNGLNVNEDFSRFLIFQIVIIRWKVTVIISEWRLFPIWRKFGFTINLVPEISIFNIDESTSKEKNSNIFSKNILILNYKAKKDCGSEIR